MKMVLLRTVHCKLPHEAQSGYYIVITMTPPPLFGTIVFKSLNHIIAIYSHHKQNNFINDLSYSN